jgi:group I intron endonuclease
MNPVMGVYAIVNEVNGNRYIGSSIDIGRRWVEHAVALENKRHHSQHLQRAYSKYGKDAFKFVLIETVDSADQLRQAEDWFLKTVKPEYNMTTGAVGVMGYRHTEEAKARMSASRSGEHHRCFGMKRSEIFGVDSSELQRGVKFTPERCKALSDIKRGKSQIKHRKQLFQFDLLGNLIGVFDRLSEASESTGICAGNISKAANKPGSRCGNFMWGHSADSICGPYKHSMSLPVEQRTKDGELVAKFNSLGEASRLTGICLEQVVNCARGLRYKTAGGFTWCYADKAGNQ